jgi:hypothetical protein
VSCGATAISLIMTGSVSPLDGGDSVWITLYSDGASEGGATF